MNLRNVLCIFGLIRNPEILHIDAVNYNYEDDLRVFFTYFCILRQTFGLKYNIRSRYFNWTILLTSWHGKSYWYLGHFECKNLMVYRVVFEAMPLISICKNENGKITIALTISSIYLDTTWINYFFFYVYSIFDK